MPKPALDRSAREKFFRRGLVIRGALAGGFLVFFGAIQAFHLVEDLPGYRGIQLALLCLLLVNLPLWVYGRRRDFPMSDFFWHWGIDITGVTAIVHWLGGTDVPMAAAAYMIMIVSSATFTSKGVALTLATSSSVAYGGVVGGEWMGFLNHVHLPGVLHQDRGVEVFFLLGAVALFFSFAFVGGALAEELRGRAEVLAQHQQQLEISVEREQAAREALILLSRIVQHDVYSPLGVIAGASDEALEASEERDQEGVRRWLKTIRGRVNSIQSAVRGLAVFGDPEAWQDTKEIVLDVLDDLAAEAAEKGVALRGSGGREEWPQVLVSREQVYHVIRNLVANGIKCVAGDGTGEIEVRSRRREDSGCEIEVVDNGPGLEEGALDEGELMTFDVSFGKHGRGLRLCHRIVRQWNGALVIDGVSRGTKIRVVFPANRTKFIEVLR